MNLALLAVSLGDAAGLADSHVAVVAVVLACGVVRDLMLLVVEAGTD